MSSNNNKVSRLANIGQVIAGIQKDFSTVPSINLGGTSYTPAALVSLLQTGVDAIKQSSVTKAAWLADVEVERNTIAALTPTLRYFKQYVVAQFGDTQDAGTKLADFGYTPRKVGTTDVAVKAEAAVKLRATRAARGTLGPKQKAKIKGTVGPEPTTVVSGAATPAPVASPAPAPVKPASSGT